MCIRDRLWHKGETSGHIQLLKEIRLDCDSDAIIFSIQQVGDIACHTGERSCFFKGIQETSNFSNSVSSECLRPLSDSCSELFKIIQSRSSNPKSGSYTNSLLNEGDNRILKKIGEESVEFVMACKDNDSKDIANEAADLIFHLQVALKFHNVEWKDVLEVLANRRNK